MDRQDDPRYPRYRPDRARGYRQDERAGADAPDGGDLWRPHPAAAGSTGAPSALTGASAAPADSSDFSVSPGEYDSAPPEEYDPADPLPEVWFPPPAEPIARVPRPSSRGATRGRGQRRPPIPRQPGPRRPARDERGAPRPPVDLPTWQGRVHVNEDLDLDEIDPFGRARRRAAGKAARRVRSNRRRRRILRWMAGGCAALVLAIAGLGTYAYEHLFGAVATESLDSLTNRPAFARADRFGNVPLNILVLGSQTRDGQHGMNLGNASKLGTDISDTAMLVHVSAERKWATVVSIPRDLVVPRPQCQGRLDTAQTVAAAPDAMFDLAMNLGGPTCAVATVEQMTGIRIDHFVEINFNAFQSLTDAIGGVTVCVPPPGINDPHYSGLVLGPGLHTVSGPESLAFVRDRHGLANGTDLNRIRMQQMFVSSLFDKLASGGTLGDPITLYKIASAVTSNLTVDTGLDSIDAMVGLAGSVQNLKTHDIQFITVPYAFDPTNQNRVIPGTGFDQVWADLRQDEPLPGSNAAADFGTAATAAPGGSGGSGGSNSGAASGPDGSSGAPGGSGGPGGVSGAGTGTGGGEGEGEGAGGAQSLDGLDVEVYNGTQVPHLALDASENLAARGADATVGDSQQARMRYAGLPGTEVLYPAGDAAQARELAGAIGGTVTTLQSSNVRALTLIIGPNAPAGLVATPGTGAAGATPDAGASAQTGASGADAGTSGASSGGSSDGPGATADPGGAAEASSDPSINTESRSGDENICAGLPDTVAYGGRP